MYNNKIAIFNIINEMKNIHLTLIFMNFIIIVSRNFKKLNTYSKRKIYQNKNTYFSLYIFFTEDRFIYYTKQNSCGTLYKRNGIKKYAIFKVVNEILNIHSILRYINSIKNCFNELQKIKQIIKRNKKENYLKLGGTYFS